MARHELDAEVEVIAENESRTADAILSQIDGADLLVMGAYGHSRMRELILGGATRAVLKNMTIPVFDVSLIASRRPFDLQRRTRSRRAGFAVRRL